MATFPHDPSLIEVFHTKLADDDPMWVAHAPLDEFLAFLDDPMGWVQDLSKAKGGADRTFNLSPQFIVEIRGLVATEISDKAPIPEPSAAEVTMMGISGTGLVVVRASKDNAQKASNHFTSHFVESLIPDEVKAKHDLKPRATPTAALSSTAPDPTGKFYDLNDEQFVDIYQHLSGNLVKLTVYRSDLRVYSHFKISDAGKMERHQRLAAVATFLFGCSAVPTRLHSILNTCEQDPHHYVRGQSEEIPGPHPRVNFGLTMGPPTPLPNGKDAAASATAATSTPTNPSFIYSSDQEHDAEACDATVGCIDGTYTYGTTEVSYTKDYTEPTS